MKKYPIKYMTKKRHARRKTHQKRHKVYNRHEPPMLGYAYNRLADVPISADLHYINNRSKDFERLEALKRVADSSKIEKVMAIEAAYHHGRPSAISGELSMFLKEMFPKPSTDRTSTTGGQVDTPHQVRGGQRTPPPSPVGSRTTTAAFEAARESLQTDMERDRLGRVRSAMPVDFTSTGRIWRMISRSEQ